MDQAWFFQARLAVNVGSGLFGSFNYEPKFDIFNDFSKATVGTRLEFGSIIRRLFSGF